jgi:3-mercaptopyruvate sulfurtransferase SseA
MTNKNRNIFLSISVLTLAILACSSFLPPAGPTVAATQVQGPSITKQPRGDIPQTEAAVPRISVKDAKAAFDSGEAIIVDVRSAESYAAGHAAGAISVPLSEIEANPTRVGLDKEQWIITYCT